MAAGGGLRQFRHVVLLAAIVVVAAGCSSGLDIAAADFVHRRMVHEIAGGKFFLLGDGFESRRGYCRRLVAGRFAGGPRVALDVAL